MENFVFNAYTEMYFGKGQIKNLPKILEAYGKKVLMVYGGGSIKKNGIYDTAKELLKDFQIFELGGVEPNPRIETVRKGVEICKNENIDVVLAIGGGSTIDCSKVIAGGAFYDGDSWDIVKDGGLIGEVLPIVTVLTLAATGSEMNGNAVISNMALNEKLGTGSRRFIPKASVCDPEYTYGLPAIQTAAGTADIMSHIFESYFKKEEGAYVQDKFAEGLLKTCIKYCPIALKEPDNYEARANLMWASSMALNGLLGSGKPGAWSCHPIEHELSAFYDITHGVGLAIVTPRWMRYILSEKTVDKFVDFGKNVWGFENNNDKYKLANMAIDALEEFFKSCGITMTLSEIGIGNEYIKEITAKAVKNGALEYAYVPLDKEDVKKILIDCL